MSEEATAPQLVDAADAWWVKQSDARRCQLHRWISGMDQSKIPELPGQLDLLEGE